MATHSSILAWKIPQTEEPGRLQSMGLQSWTRLCDFTFTFPSPGDLPNPGIKLLTEKRCTTWELQVKFYLGQNEDCSPGGSISDSSERLLQSGRGGRSIYKVLVKEEFNTMKHSFLQKVFCYSWGSDVTMMGFSVFLDIRRLRIEIIKSVPKNIQLSRDLSQQIPWSTECLTPPWIPSGFFEGQ